MQIVGEGSECTDRHVGTIWIDRGRMHRGPDVDGRRSRDHGSLTGSIASNKQSATPLPRSA